MIEEKVLLALDSYIRMRDENVKNFVCVQTSLARTEGACPAGSTEASPSSTHYIFSLSDKIEWKYRKTLVSNSLFG